ncbi:hypothetical protein DERF_009892 [Dermatophagoides farinae]|uniref:Uncharacterized protein n=1 Tax=Dermatophagoides farinae TaxID=6954 RepID=A0A922HUU2_DERFA|nr:hypothetical protein DERF_009892 [Dermatophagoides farinae]
MICLGSLQGGSRKQPRPSTVTTLLNRFSLNHQPEMKNKTVFLIIKTNFLLTECDPPMNIFHGRQVNCPCQIGSSNVQN